MTSLNSTWLRSFTVLCEEENFTKAAARLNMTQPGMSQHIAKLEHKLQSSLIDRDAPGFVLTSAGQKTLIMAKARWLAEKAFLESLSDGNADRGIASVACSGSFAMLLYPALTSWMANAPDLSIELTAAPKREVFEGVLSGKFGLGVTTDFSGHPRIDAEPLGTEHLDLILPVEWKNRTPAFDDLQALGYIHHPDGATYADRVLASNYRSEYEGIDRLRIKSFINQIGQIPVPVANGIGYTILPRSGVLAFPDRETLTTARLPNWNKTELFLIWPKGRKPSAPIEKMIAIIREEARKLD